VGVGTRCWDLRPSCAALATMKSFRIFDRMLYPLSDGTGPGSTSCSAHSLPKFVRAGAWQEEGRFDWIR
jgi:hypothetical protein